MLIVVVLALCIGICRWVCQDDDKGDKLFERICEALILMFIMATAYQFVKFVIILIRKVIN